MAKTPATVVKLLGSEGEEARRCWAVGDVGRPGRAEPDRGRASSDEVAARVGDRYMVGTPRPVGGLWLLSGSGRDSATLPGRGRHARRRRSAPGENGTAEEAGGRSAAGAAPWTAGAFWSAARHWDPHHVVQSAQRTCHDVKHSWRSPTALHPCSSCSKLLKPGRRAGGRRDRHQYGDRRPAACLVGADTSRSASAVVARSGHRRRGCPVARLFTKQGRTPARFIDPHHASSRGRRRGRSSVGRVLVVQSVGHDKLGSSKYVRSAREVHFTTPATPGAASPTYRGLRATVNALAGGTLVDAQADRPPFHTPPAVPLRAIASSSSRRLRLVSSEPEKFTGE